MDTTPTSSPTPTTTSPATSLPTTGGGPAAGEAPPVVLRLGRSVEGLDGPLGTVGAIVVDPVAREVSHVVVEPMFHRHRQARLVPAELIDPHAPPGRVRIGLDADGLLGLDPFRVVEFVPLGHGIELHGGWDVADEHVVGLPNWHGRVFAGPIAADLPVEVRVDRVPRGECEVRRASRVVDVTGRTVGHVDGLIVDDGHVLGAIVARRALGLRHLVAVPIDHVSSVAPDLVRLDVERGEVDRFPRPSELTPPARTSLPSPLEAQLSLLTHRAVAATRSVVGRIREAVRR
jgi:hypothetical protein